MKLFDVIKEEISPAMRYTNGDIAFPQQKFKVCKLNEECIAYLLDDNIDSRVIQGIRYLIANIYNAKAFPNVELFSIIRGADREHEELIMDIINSCTKEYGESCFLMIEELAPKIIEKFFINSVSQAAISFIKNSWIDGRASTGQYEYGLFLNSCLGNEENINIKNLLYRIETQTITEILNLTSNDSLVAMIKKHNPAFLNDRSKK